MKVMLTSFGIQQAYAAASRGASPFYRVPPVSFRLVSSKFSPDYELLILCDQIVMDESSFQQLVDRPAATFAGVAETFRALRGDGRIELVDFGSILRANSDLLNKMLNHDMNALDRWVESLRESLTTWRHFAESFRRILHAEHSRPSTLRFDTEEIANLATHTKSGFGDELISALHYGNMHTAYIDMMVGDALSPSKMRSPNEYRSALQDLIQPYLAYVNANLVLASELKVPFHDWQDFMPFYSTKFLSMGKREHETQRGRKEVERLFTIAFPDLAIQDSRTLLKVLNDKRVQDLRNLVGDAVHGRVKFDEHFANSVLAEVLRSERRLTRFRSILGYVALTIGVIPVIATPAQKFVEEITGVSAAKKLKRKRQWFYMLSDFADSWEDVTI